jgi:hypothetical protein
MTLALRNPYLQSRSWEPTSRRLARFDPHGSVREKSDVPVEAAALKESSLWVDSEYVGNSRWVQRVPAIAISLFAGGATDGDHRR